MVEKEAVSDLTLDLEELRVAIKAETDFIRKAIDSVAPEVYFSRETIDELKQEQHSKTDKKINEINVKRNAKKLSKKSKHKRAKFDPQLQWSVSNIHQQMVLNKSESPASNLVGGESLTRDELKQRLQAKIKSLRNASLNSLAEDVEKKREKRRLSKMKMREKRKKQKVGVKNEEEPSNKKQKKDDKKLMDANSIVFNKDKGIVFNKFTFDETGTGEKIKGDLTGKDYKHLIQKVEHQNQKIKKLEETDRNKAELLKEKTKWKTALSRAEGIKVKDNLPMLKKALDRKNQRKKKSEKKWKGIEDHVQKKQEARQKKRKDNLQKRKKSKIQKKIKRSIKKGRMIQGVTNI